MPKKIKSQHPSAAMLFTRGYTVATQSSTTMPAERLAQTMPLLFEVSWICQGVCDETLIFSGPVDLLYGRVFSYDGVLNDLETGYVIVSALIGLDCQNQLRHHMKGALYNGATREDLEELYVVLLDLAERLGVKFRSGKREIPNID